ncbi:hypothetical protein [Streptomyces sp. NPDC086182]|uniref:hypothetical protein n=1 Tax=Streptomyces sp. NPDC086182 TaxID=3155058 RepID=UPI00342F6DC0
MLVRHLPRDSALLREVQGEAAEWSVTDHLLAAVVDQLTQANWMFATVNQDEDAAPLDFPEPLPRPGVPPEDPGPADTAPAMPSPADMARFLA